MAELENAGLERAGLENGSRGLLRVNEEECKGCGLCMEACPPHVILQSERLNHCGYRPAVYSGAGCTACGICFMVCPEPGAITVLRRIVRKPDAAAVAQEVEEAVLCASN